MRVLLYGINFAPELTGCGKYTGEMAEALVRAGHEVRVVTAQPYFPGWQAHPGYSSWRYSKEIHEGARVWRAPHYIPPHPSGLKRLAHLASFALSSLPLMLRQAFWRPHVVWMAAPTLLCAPIALATARLCGAKTWLHIQDFEAEAAFELGLLSNPLARRFAVAIERGLFNRFHRISSISTRMLVRLRRKGVERERMAMFPNWVDTSVITPLDRPSAYREHLGIPHDAVVALYSGSMGNKQGLEVMAEAARILEHDRSLYFVFCGEGPGRKRLQEACDGLTNVCMLPLQPAAHLNQLLGMADMHLMPQRRGVADLVMPSKLMGMFASGRAIVATADENTSVAEVVDGRGLVVPPEEPQALAAAIATLVRHPGMRKAFGEAGRAYAERSLSAEPVLAAFERKLRFLGDPGTAVDTRTRIAAEAKLESDHYATQAGFSASETMQIRSLQ